MIVTSTPFGSRLVTQSDHARLAAEMLRLFRLPELIDQPRRAVLLRAIAEHDNGWWEADSAPRLDESLTGALDFRALEPQLRREIWRRGVERFADESPYLAALIGTHSLRLLRRIQRRPQDPPGAAFREEMEVRQSELLEASGETLASLALDDPWLEVADNLSLAVCTGEASFVSMPGWRAEVAGDRDTIELGLQPFHLAGSTSFELACRWLAPRRFSSAAELAGALAAAGWTRTRVRVRPL